VKTDQTVNDRRFEGVRFCAEDLRGGPKIVYPWNEHGFTE